MSPLQKKNSRRNNQVRIIGGDWRGRKLSFPSIDDLRPTGDRIRETLFNWLAPAIHGMDGADLFAGSGALGFEALSRGANSVDMVEVDNRVADSLQRNLELLGSRHGKVFRQSAELYLQTKPSHSLDLIFLDPPFKQNLHNQIITSIHHSAVLRPQGLVYIETDLNTELLIPENWRPEKKKTSGQVCYQMFRVN